MAIVFKSFSAIGLVAVWKIQETYLDLLKLAELSLKENQLFSRFSVEKRQVEFLAVRCLINELMGEKTEVAYSPEGIPLLDKQNKYISISHSGDFVAVYLSDRQDVGIDIEKKARRAYRVKEKFLNEDELKALADCDEHSDWFTVFWSVKEAVFKMMRMQAVDFRSQIVIREFNQKQNEIVADFRLNDSIYTIYLHIQTIDKDYILAYNKSL